MKKILAVAVLTALTSTSSYAESLLNKSSANRFLQDFYVAVKNMIIKNWI